MKRILLTRAMLCLFLGLFFNIASGEALATTRRVSVDHPTIQQAINAAVNGDTVLVAPGTYVENINFNGKAIAVLSEAGPLVTIIDGNHANSVVTFHSSEGPMSIISGFTLRNGDASGFSFNINFEGGGIDVENASPLILRNIITNNRASNGGGGISVRGFSSAQIIGNTISNNSWSVGAGITLFASGPTIIRNNTISNNTGFGQGGGNVDS